MSGRWHVRLTSRGHGLHLMTCQSTIFILDPHVAFMEPTAQWFPQVPQVNLSVRGYTLPLGIRQDKI